MVLVWAHIAATFLMRYIPVPFAHRVVGWFTPIALFFAHGYRRRAERNMERVLGAQADPGEIRRLTTAAFANYARYMVDLVRLPSLDYEALRRDVRVEGWEHVEQAYAMDRGVVFVTGHIGSWDLAGAAFTDRGRMVNVLVETLSPPQWNARVQRIRELVGMNAIPIETGVRDMLGALRRKEGLAILVDRPLERDGVPVTFFNRTTQVPGGAATLALRSGAPVVPAVLVRDPSGSGYLAHIGEPMLGEKTGTAADDVQALTQRIMAWLEEMIRQYPDQWYMFRSMWPDSPSPRSHLIPAEAS